MSVGVSRRSCQGPRERGSRAVFGVWGGDPGSRGRLAGGGVTVPGNAGTRRCHACRGTRRAGDAAGRSDPRLRAAANDVASDPTGPAAVDHSRMARCGTAGRCFGDLGRVDLVYAGYPGTGCSDAGCPYAGCSDAGCTHAG